MERRGNGRGICGEFAQGSVGISRPHTNDRNGKSGKTSAAEKQERETRSEILCRELARQRARSIPVVSAARRLMERCRNGIKTEIARRERGTARKRARDLLRICAGRERTKCGKIRETEKQSGGKAGSAKRGAKYFAGNLRDCEQDRYPRVLAARRHTAHN